jgi:hypothetical protein
VRGPLFPRHLQVRLDRELRETIETEARRDRTTASELVRRELRNALASRRSVIGPMTNAVPRTAATHAAGQP